MSKTNTKVSPKGTKPTQLLKQLDGTTLSPKEIKAIKMGIPKEYRQKGFLEKKASHKILLSVGEKIGFDSKTLKGFGKTKRAVSELRSLISANIHWDKVPVSKKRKTKSYVTGGDLDKSMMPAETPKESGTRKKSPKGTRAKSPKETPVSRTEFDQLVQMVRGLVETLGAKS